MDFLWLAGVFAGFWLVVGVVVAGSRGARAPNTVRFDAGSISFGLAFPAFALVLLGLWVARGGDVVAAVSEGDWLTRSAWVVFPTTLVWAFIQSVRYWSWRVELSEAGVRQWQYGREQRFAPWSSITSGQAYNEALVFHLVDGTTVPMIYQNTWIRLVRSWCIDMDRPFYDGKQRKFTKQSD